MSEYPLNVRFTLDDEWVETLIEMAGFGITYWVSAASTSTTRKGRYYHLSPFDPDTGEAQSDKRVTFGGLVRAAQKILDGQCALAPEYVQHVFAAVMDAGDLDAEIADHIVQVAVLGDVLYC
jgi:hypothetical protein